jgi:hypothetical protein
MLRNSPGHVAGRLIELYCHQAGGQSGLGAPPTRQLPNNFAASSTAWHLDDVADDATASGQLCCVEQAAHGSGVSFAGHAHHRARAKPGFLQPLQCNFSVGRGRRPPGDATSTGIPTAIKAKSHAVDDALKIRDSGVSFGALGVGDRCSTCPIFCLSDAQLF